MLVCTVCICMAHSKQGLTTTLPNGKGGYGYVQVYVCVQMCVCVRARESDQVIAMVSMNIRSIA